MMSDSESEGSLAATQAVVAEGAMPQTQQVVPDALPELPSLWLRAFRQNKRNATYFTLPTAAGAELKLGRAELGDPTEDLCISAKDAITISRDSEGSVFITAKAHPSVSLGKENLLADTPTKLPLSGCFRIVAQQPLGGKDKTYLGFQLVDSLNKPTRGKRSSEAKSRQKAARRGRKRKTTDRPDDGTGMQVREAADGTARRIQRRIMQVTDGLGKGDSSAHALKTLTKIVKDVQHSKRKDQAKARTKKRQQGNRNGSKRRRPHYETQEEQRQGGLNCALHNQRPGTGRGGSRGRNTHAT